MSEMMMCQANDNTENVDQKALELAQDFSYDGYQVVRRELFAHLREPAVVITGVSLCQKTGTIRIFRSTIKELSDPKYIRFLFSRILA